uniref:Putative carbon dioxide concentrating mechanism/carboxysome shell protein n=1 Tax=termite gut metagenome TaxID=433724 RepID=S0DDC4_9ZZZZ
MELNSIARGIEAADAILKASDVELISACAGCPGKYYILFCGGTAAADVALAAGAAVGGAFVVDRTLIPNIHPHVIRAMTKTTEIPQRGALGVLEFFSVTASIYAADAAVKAADIQLVELRAGMGVGGKSYIILAGDVAAVKTAVDVGISEENALGMLINSAVIPNPSASLFEYLY